MINLLLRCAALAVCLAPTLASAQTAVMLFGPTGSESLRDTAGVEALAVVAAGLEGAGMLVLDRQTARARLAERGAAPCDEEDCVASALATLDAHLAVAVAVWADRRTGAPREVALTLLGAAPPMVNAAATVDPDVATAARVALADALAQWGGAARAALRVEGTPRGAGVTIDSRPAGLLPLATDVPLGELEVTVSMAGYQSERRTVEVVPSDTPMVVHFALERGHGATNATDHQDTPSTSGRAVVGPVLLGVVGLGAAVALAVELARPGCVERPADGVCRQDRDLRTGNVAAFGLVAVAGFTGAVLWFSLSGDDEADASTRVGLGPGMLQLSTDF